jgi:hypothetical protein
VEVRRLNLAARFDIKMPGIDDNLLLSEDAMARAVITTDFASPAETAQVLGVSRASREKLVRMAELAISRSGSRRGKAGSNGAARQYLGLVAHQYGCCNISITLIDHSKFDHTGQ